MLLLLLLLLLMGPLFVFEEGMMMKDFFPLFYGIPSSFGLLQSSPPGFLIWAGLDPGPGPSLP